MYIALLISKYLRRKLAPMFAAMAVTLCTAMVIIVISVMGGFLNMMRQAAQTLTGQVTIYSDPRGFAGHQEISKRLLAEPNILATAPLVRSYGLMKLGESTPTVEVVGIEPQSFNTVTSYESSLYWSNKDLLENLKKRIPTEGLVTAEMKKMYADQEAAYQNADLNHAGMTFEIPQTWKREGIDWGCVLGIAVNPWNLRDTQGKYDVGNSAIGIKVTLSVLPVTQGGSFQPPATAQFTLVNEFKSGLYDIDANRIYIPLQKLQEMLDMQQQKVWKQFDPQTGEAIGEPTIRPDRVSELMVKGKPGIPLQEIKDTVTRVVQQYLTDYPDADSLWIQTWEERHATLLGAVEREKGMLTILFAIISLVAVAMIAVIFYMIVQQKTKDIGTLRALGASRKGIASIFLGYGLAVGIIGSLLGLALAASIVLNLNEIQDLLFQWFGFKMWNPQIYYFDRIPSQLDHKEVAVIVICAILSSVIGAIVPAILAAIQDPVESLRYE
jgi:lipoprotein-releasing system permease protein